MRHSAGGVAREERGRANVELDPPLCQRRVLEIFRGVRGLRRNEANAGRLGSFYGLAMAGSDTPWEPPLAGTEAEHLVGALDRLRATFRWKAGDLDAVGLQTRVGRSSLTLGGLLKHLARAEEQMLSTKLSARRSVHPGTPRTGTATPTGTSTRPLATPPDSCTPAGTALPSGPARGSLPLWPTAVWTSPPTSPHLTGAMPACAACSAT